MKMQDHINTLRIECQHLFLHNKYTNWYFNIIKNSNNRKLDKSVYIEKHHIIPKSLGGSNKSTNICKLTPREHFLVHWLLTKMLVKIENKNKMQYALRRLMNETEKSKKYIWSKWHYTIAKKHSLEVNKRTKSGENNPMYGKKHTDLAKSAISAKNTGLKRSNEHKQIISESNKGKKHKKESIEKIRNAHLGRKLHEETKIKMSESQKNVEKLQCPYCGVFASPSNAKRWHYNNCKLFS
jgi:hypothetical protein